ncbi:hypothetical protein Unana1_02306 [Umbelopsis nana]
MYAAKPHVPPKKKEPEKIKSKRIRVKATASGRSKRKISNDEAKPRTENDSRKQVFALKRARLIVTLNVGDLSASVRRATIDPSFEGKLLTTIRSLVRIMSAAKRLVQLATDLLLMYVMEYFPYRDFLSNQARSRIFTPLLYGKDGGKVYQQNLLRLVISGQKESVDIDKFIDGLVHSNQESHQVERGVGDLEHTKNIRFPLDNASAMDDISKFYFTNKLLPEVARYAMTPQSGFKDDFIDITEEGLVLALGTSDDVKAYLQKAFGIMDSKVTKRELRSAAKRQKGVLIINSLFRLGNHKHGHEYSETVRLLADESLSRPYVLDGTFRTNVQLVATSQTPKRVSIIGIDLGERFIAAARGINFANSDNIRNLAIKHSVLYQPTLKFWPELEQRKPTAVRQAEQSISCKKKCTFAESSEYAHEVIKAEPVLRSFYGSKRCKRLIHDSKKARRSEFDDATNALLRMAGGHIGRKRMPGEDMLFAVGLGDFNTKTNLSSLHTSFGSHFINKVRSLGYMVVGVDEFYTSKKALVADIAKVAKSQFNEFCRPEYLTVPTAKHSVSSALLKRKAPDEANENAESKKRKLTTRSRQTAPSQIGFEADATLIR